MKVLARNRNNEVVYLIPSHYGAIYSRLQRLLPDNLMIFAEPQQQSQDSLWLYHGSGQATPYHSLSNDDKDWVSEELELTKGKILQALTADAEFSRFTGELFKVSGEEDIWLIEENGKRKVILTKWACTPADNPSMIDPLSRVIARERRDYEQVIVDVKYSDGIPLQGEEILVEYKGRELLHTTTAEGTLNLGKAKAGQEIAMTAYPGTEHPQTETFSVVRGHGEYHVVLPFLLDIQFQVIDQEKNSMTGYTMEINDGNRDLVFTTDEEGGFLISGIVLENKPLRAQVQGKPGSAKEFAIDRETKKLVYELFDQKYADFSILVLDEEDEVVPDYPIEVQKQNERLSYLTDQWGHVSLPQQEEEVVLEIYDGRDFGNWLSHKIIRGGNSVSLKVKIKAKVSLLDHKNKAIPGAALSFKGNELNVSGSTNQQGQYLLNTLKLMDQEKVKVGIEVKRKNNKNNKKKPKKYKRNLVYSVDQQEYVLKLKSRWWLWLFLLLLLPLLLLIRWEKDLVITTTHAETQTALPNTPVRFNYSEAFAYDKGSFFTDTVISEIQRTDENGELELNGMRYSLYSWLFRGGSKFFAIAGDQCFASDSVEIHYHAIDDGEELELQLLPKYMDFDFLVVDKSDNQPLPGATVTVDANFAGKDYQASAESGADGRVVFNDLPVCGTIDEIKANLFGYHPDSMEQMKFSEITGKLDPTRKLELDPLKTTLTFYVKDCDIPRGIGGATVDVSIDYGGQKPNEQTTVKTNINGVGKAVGEGQLEDVRIIGDVSMRASHPQYLPDSVGLGPLPVNGFNDRDSSERTICLKPKPNPATFENRDCLTEQALPGVRNKVIIENGAKKTETELISDQNGQFIISFRPGDKVSIVSEYPPDYQRNDTTIVNQDGMQLNTGSPSERIIRLCPEEVELTFRTVEAQNPSAPVPNADILAQVHPKGSSNLLSGPDGTFTIKAPVTGTVSIDASKAGYGSNHTKVQNHSVKELLAAAQQERDIPLELEPIQVQFRDIDSNTGQEISGAENKIYINGQHKATEYGGQFTVKALPTDKIRIEASYKGARNDSTVNGSKTLQELQDGPQDLRDIPLDAPPVCEVSAGQVEKGFFQESYSVGKGDFTLVINYKMQSHPDHLIVYCGKKADPNKILAQTGGPAGGPVAHSEGGPLRIDLGQCRPKWITVEIIPDGGDTGSNWEFEIGCVGN